MKKKKRNNVTRPRLSTHSILYKCPICEQTFPTENEIYTVSVDDTESDISFNRMFPRTTYTVSFGITKEIAEHVYKHYHPDCLPERYRRERRCRICK